MPAAHTIAFLPAPADLPPGLDVDTILADLADDGVSAPATEVPALQELVARAHDGGLDLRVVVLAENPVRDSQLRDVATEVGVHDGGTVLVLSPNWVGTWSDSLPRSTVEDAQDYAYTGNAVDSANQFLDAALRPDPPYTLITIVLLAVVACGAAATWMLRARRQAATDRD